MSVFDVCIGAIAPPGPFNLSIVPPVACGVHADFNPIVDVRIDQVHRLAGFGACDSQEQANHQRGNEPDNEHAWIFFTIAVFHG
ncbi:TPA: hypothetical protein ROA76_004377 [Escherichia coli]|nr:hypothetical protein [Escherichia coli]